MKRLICRNPFANPSVIEEVEISEETAKEYTRVIYGKARFLGADGEWHEPRTLDEKLLAARYRQALANSMLPVPQKTKEKSS